MNRVLIMDDNIHNHVIMNIIVNPTHGDLLQFLGPHGIGLQWY